MKRGSRLDCKHKKDSAEMLMNSILIICVVPIISCLPSSSSSPTQFMALENVKLPSRRQFVQAFVLKSIISEHELMGNSDARSPGPSLPTQAQIVQSRQKKLGINEAFAPAPDSDAHAQ